MTDREASRGDAVTKIRELRADLQGMINSVDQRIAEKKNELQLYIGSGRVPKDEARQRVRDDLEEITSAAGAMFEDYIKDACSPWHDNPRSSSSQRLRPRLHQRLSNDNSRAGSRLYAWLLQDMLLAKADALIDTHEPNLPTEDKRPEKIADIVAELEQLEAEKAELETELAAAFGGFENPRQRARPSVTTLPPAEPDEGDDAEDGAPARFMRRDV